jgi:hypothetical protein
MYKIPAMLLSPQPALWKLTRRQQSSPRFVPIPKAFCWYLKVCHAQKVRSMRVIGRLVRRRATRRVAWPWARQERPGCSSLFWIALELIHLLYRFATSMFSLDRIVEGLLYGALASSPLATRSCDAFPEEALRVMQAGLGHVRRKV